MLTQKGVKISMLWNMTGKPGIPPNQEYTKVGLI